MRSLIFLLLIASVAVLAAACDRAEPQVAPANTAFDPSWAKYCTLNGIAITSAEDRTFLKKLVSNCSAQDACILSCARSGCAAIGGGCSHACSLDNEHGFVIAADEFASKSSYFCKWRRPN
jgi:hypothetical protein